MLPARALFYAILVSLLMSLIIGVMLLASSNQHQLVNHYNTQNRLLYNCASAVQLLMASSQDSIPETVIDLYQSQKDSISITQKKWGLLDVGFVASWSGKDTVKRSFLIGKQAPDYALKLAEGTSPLKVCGNTQVIGTTYLPREGVERGRVNGKYYENGKTIFGKVNQVGYINQDFLKNRFLEIEKLSTFQNSTSDYPDTIIHSFGKPTKVLIANYWNTSNWFLKDNIVLVAQNKIVLTADALLQDIIVIAPVIEIQSGFAGNIQAFASDSIVVQEGVDLIYPSVLGLLPNSNKDEFSPSLTIDNNSIIQGAIVVPTLGYQEREAIVTIKKQARVEGVVWVNAQLQHQGEIIGSVFCKNFFLQTASSIYENYLLDAVIDRPSLPSSFLVPTLFSDGKYRGIIKRLE
jgi:hypothetical protein